MCPHVSQCKSKFVRHLRKHTGEKPFVCDVCQKTFSRDDKLKSHYMSMHSESLSLRLPLKDKQPFACLMCPYVSQYKSTFMRHLLKHTGEKPFVCDVCQKTFSRRDKLTSHYMSKHSENNPFVCSICQKTFSRNDKLKDHEKLGRCHHVNGLSPNAAYLIN
nr:oocyte zinc finger protein XlCOF15-like [Parasteatoda tepidariorum]